MSDDLIPTPTRHRGAGGPFDLEKLPRVSGATVELIREISLRRHFLSRPREIMVSPFGRVSIHCVDTGAPLVGQTDREVWGVVRAYGSERPGTLVCDRMTALRITYPSLGLPTPRVARPLGTTERGVAAAMMAGVVRRISNDFSLSIYPPGRPRGDLARITLALDIDRFREYAHLHVPPHWLPLDRPASLPAEAARRGLQIPLQIELGRTHLALRDWYGAEPGDAVLFEGIPFPTDVAASSVAVRCGSYVAAGELALDQGVVIRSPFEYRAPRRRHVSPSHERTSPPMPTTADDRSSRFEALLAAPIEVVAEIGRVAVSAEEVLALAPGAVLPIGWLRSDSISLRIDDRTWARGELVDVDGQLGVRVTEIVDHRPPQSPGDAPPIR